MAVPYVATAQEKELVTLIESLGGEMLARYSEAEDKLIRLVASYSADLFDDPQSTAAASLARFRVIADLRRQSAAIAQQLRDPEFVARILAVAASEGQQAAAVRLGQTVAAGSAITPTAAHALAASVLDLTNRLDDMTLRISRWAPDAYQRVVSMATASVVLGTDTLQQAQRTAAQRFLARGITGFTDTAGRNWRIGSYAEMATRTSVNRSWMNANIDQQQSSGISLCTIVAGAGACNACASHAGKVYSTDGTPGGSYTLTDPSGKQVQVDVAGTLDEARGNGWNHPNCRCVVVAYLPGLSIPTGTTYDPQAEADRDRLRSLERDVRDLKRRDAASFDDMESQRIRRAIRVKQAQIRDHVEATGLNRRRYREQLGFSDGRPQMPALPAPRPVSPAGQPMPVSIPVPLIRNV